MTAAVLLSVLVGWSAADLLVAGSGTVGGALVGAVFAAGVLLAARALGAG